MTRSGSFLDSSYFFSHSIHPSTLLVPPCLSVSPTVFSISCCISLTKINRIQKTHHFSLFHLPTSASFSSQLVLDSWVWEISLNYRSFLSIRKMEKMHILRVGRNQERTIFREGALSLSDSASHGTLNRSVSAEREKWFWSVTYSFSWKNDQHLSCRTIINILLQTVLWTMKMDTFPIYFFLFHSSDCFSCQWFIHHK